MPPAVPLKAYGVLGDEHSPPSARALAESGPVLGEGGRCSRHTDRRRVPEGAPVARRLQSKRVRIGHPMPPVELESDEVEVPAVVLGPAATAAPRNRREPVRQLVEDGQALVDGIGTGPDPNNADVPTGEAARRLGRPLPPGQAGRGDAGSGAYRIRQFGRPRRCLHEQPFSFSASLTEPSKMLVIGWCRR